jgi:hypothetical protein
MDAALARASAERLHATLAVLGVDPSWTAQDWEILSQSPPDLAEMGHTYGYVNEHLKRIDRRSGLAIRHITGEARALVDCAHRGVLRHAAEIRRTPAQLACHVRADGPASVWDFLGQQLPKWPSVEWYDIVDILALVAERVVTVFVLERPETVHYSLFGEEFVLLQEQHEHPRNEKWVWYLRARGLVEKLQPRVSTLLEEAQELSASDFAAALEWLYRHDSVSSMRRLRDGGGLSMDGGEAQAAGLAHLRAIGFVDVGGALTAVGSRWLEELLPEMP